jgi:hypothetical protein
MSGGTHYKLSFIGRSSQRGDGDVHLTISLRRILQHNQEAGL